MTNFRTLFSLFVAVFVTMKEYTKLNVSFFKFFRCLSSRPSNVYTTILACTDENESMEYLNNWDKNIQRLGYYLKTFNNIHIISLFI